MAGKALGEGYDPGPYGGSAPAPTGTTSAPAPSAAPASNYNPNDPSTWGPIVGTSASGAPIYANQPGATPGSPTASGGDGTTKGAALAVLTGGIYGDGTAKDAMGVLSGYSPVKGLLGKLGLGGGDSGASEKQTALAQNTVAPSNTQSIDIYNRAIAQANNANAIKTPDKVTGVGITAAQVDPGAYNVNTNTQAGVDDASIRMRAYEAAQAQASAAAVGNLREANVSNVAAVQGADVARVNTGIVAPTIGDAAQTGAVNVERTQLDPLANQLRQSEIKAAQDIASGPSSAMDQFKAGQSQVVSDQLAAAAAARGAERAGARREAMINIGAKGAQNALAASALASQEDQAKRVAAANALSGIRSPDVTSATNAAAITSQQQNLQAQLDSAIAQGNTAAVNDIKQKQAALALQARQSEVQAGLGQQNTLANVAEFNTGLQQQTALANAAAKNKAAADYAASSNAAYEQFAQSQSAASLANAGLTTTASKDYASAYNAAAQTAASQQSATNLANAALAQSQAQANASRAAGLATTNAGAINTANTTNAANTIAVQGTNATNQLNADQLRQISAVNALNAGTNAITNQTKNAATVVDANKAAASAAAQQSGALIGAAGAIGAAYASGGSSGAAASDERAKIEISPVGGRSTYADRYGQMLSDSLGPTSAHASPYGTLSDLRAKREVDRMSMDDISEFTRETPAVTYRYKPGIEDGGAAYQAGTLAQGVEKASPLGRMFVDTRPDGLKEVKYGPMAHFEAKGAQHTADKALALAEEAYRRAR